MLEGLWGSCLTFSNLSLDDLIYLWSAVILEKSIVFISEDITLLTSTIKTFKQLIKPYKFAPNTITIMTLWEEMFDAMYAPNGIQILVGIN